MSRAAHVKRPRPGDEGQRILNWKSGPSTVRSLSTRMQSERALGSADADRDRSRKVDPLSDAVTSNDEVGTRVDAPDAGR